MKKILFNLCIPLFLFSQKNESLLSSGGSNIYSIGECFVSTLRSQNIILSQGFHQTYPFAPNSVYETSAKNNFKIFPIPAYDILNLEFLLASKNNDEHFLQIIDLMGKIIYESIIGQQQKSVLLHLKSFQPGFYILRIENLNNHQTYIHSFQKI